MKKLILSALCLSASLIGLNAQSAKAQSIPTSVWNSVQPTILNKAQTGFNDQPFQSYMQQEQVSLAESNLFRIDPSLLKLKYTHNVSAYFINEGTGLRNQLAYTASGATNQSGLIFKDVSCGGRGCGMSGGAAALKLGDGVNLGDIQANTQLDFKLRANGLRRGSDSYIFGAKDSENADGLQHVVAYAIKDTGYILMGFEDLYGDGKTASGKFGEKSDRDFNDTMFVIDIGKDNMKALAVPEPSAMFSLLGLAAAGALKFRRRKSA